MEIFDQRLERFKEVSHARQCDLAVILENVHDPHNIGAVLRTCDAVGVHEVFLLDTDPRLYNRQEAIGHSSSSGAVRWIPLHFYHDVAECMTAVKSKYGEVWGARIASDSIDLYELQFDRRVALLFGNEKDGISEESSKYLNQNFVIPQYGFTQSLNISVACAVSLYEASRQRKIAGRYDDEKYLAEKEALYEQYIDIHTNHKMRKKANRIDFDK